MAVNTFNAHFLSRLAREAREVKERARAKREAQEREAEKNEQEASARSPALDLIEARPGLWMTREDAARMKGKQS